MTERKADASHYAFKKVWQCTERVWLRGDSRSSQCSNKAKYDPDTDGNPTKCGTHCDAAKERRKQKADDRYAQSKSQIQRHAKLHNLRSKLIPLIASIAEGHNDPRTACREWLDRYEAAQGAEVKE